MFAVRSPWAFSPSSLVITLHDDMSMRKSIERSVILAAAIFLLGICGCGETENHGCEYEPCSKERLSAIAGFPVGDWEIDGNSLEFLRKEFKWTTLTNQCDHWLSIHDDGTALVLACRGSYGNHDDVDYRRQLDVAESFGELTDVGVLSPSNCVSGQVNVRAKAYKMRWKLVGRDEFRRSKDDNYGGFFDRCYFNVDYPNQFEVGVVFLWKHGEELFFAVGEDATGIYLTPRVRSLGHAEPMKLALKFRRYVHEKSH